METKYLIVGLITFMLGMSLFVYAESTPTKKIAGHYKLASNIQPAPPVCGNNWCQAGETIFNCYADCGNVCGNNLCEPVENNETCSQDCTSNYGYLNLELFPEEEIYPNEDFNFIIHQETLNTYILVTKLNIKKRNNINYQFYDTNECYIVGQLPNYEYINPIILDSVDPLWLGYMSGTLTLRCNSPGRYRFIVTNWVEAEYSNEYDKSILTP